MEHIEEVKIEDMIEEEIESLTVYSDDDRRRLNINMMSILDIAGGYGISTSTAYFYAKQLPNKFKIKVKDIQARSHYMVYNRQAIGWLMTLRKKPGNPHFSNGLYQAALVARRWK